MKIKYNGNLYDIKLNKKETKELKEKGFLINEDEKIAIIKNGDDVYVTKIIADWQSVDLDCDDNI